MRRIAGRGRNIETRLHAASRMWNFDMPHQHVTLMELTSCQIEKGVGIRLVEDQVARHLQSQEVSHVSASDPARLYTPDCTRNNTLIESLETVARASQASRPRRDVAYHHIQRKISTRQLRAGEPVSDVAISKELGISRTPAREAIRQLVSEGLLESVPGRGVVVITLDRDDIRELFEMREALEGLAARTVAGRAPLATEIRDLRSIASALTALTKELEASRKPVLDERQMERFEVADLAFHTYIMKLAGNKRSLKTLAGIRLLIRIFAARRGGHNAAALKQINRDHLDLISALQAADPQAAVECVHRHILKSQKSRLNEFDQREREAAVPQDVESFMDQIRAELT